MGTLLITYLYGRSNTTSDFPFCQSAAQLLLNICSLPYAGKLQAFPEHTGADLRPLRADSRKQFDLGILYYYFQTSVVRQQEAALFGNPV